MLYGKKVPIAESAPVAANQQNFLSRYMPSPQYTVSTNTARFDVEMIYRFLTNCYWAEGIPRDVVQRSIENAMCFGVFDGDNQVGFARVARITARRKFCSWR